MKELKNIYICTYKALDYMHINKKAFDNQYTTFD